MSKADRVVGRPWNVHEDGLLRQAVAIHGENDNWKAIALSVPGRTNKACRKRWLHSLSPTVKKSAWTAEEDRLLLELYAKHSIKWSVIARQIPGRTDDACSKRYREALDPLLKKDEWTEDEDKKLLTVYARLGGKWGQVGQELQRSGLGCRNRWRLLERKRLASTPTQCPSTPQTQGQYPLTGEPSAHNQWSPASVLNVPRYWIDEDSHDYQTGSSTLPFGQMSSYAHTQEMDSRSLNCSAGPSIIADGIHDLDHFPSQYQMNAYSLGATMSAVQDVHMPPENYQDATVTMQSFDSTDGIQNSALMSQPNSSDFTGLSDARLPEFDEDNDMDDDSAQPRDLDMSDNVSSPIDGTLALLTSPSDGSSSESEAHPIPPVPDIISMQISLASNDDGISPSPSLNNTVSRVTAIHTNEPSLHHHSALKLVSSKSAPKRRTNLQAPLRLDGDLPVTSDPSLRPYACGHCVCRSLESSSNTSSPCFATSRELNDHNKIEHSDDILGGGKPFRCGLEGCEKAWKSINGLQYHLQVSKAHFQRALSAACTSALLDGESGNRIGSTSSGTSSKEQPPEKSKAKKIHSCPHLACSKQYKQLSGLRYHLTHGHPNPEDIPTQVDAIPPVLARELAANKKKEPGATTVG